jgi:hypothetical protein
MTNYRKTPKLALLSPAVDNAAQAVIAANTAFTNAVAGGDKSTINQAQQRRDAAVERLAELQRDLAKANTLPADPV